MFRILKLTVPAALVAAAGLVVLAPQALSRPQGSALDEALTSRLDGLGFTGAVETTLTERLGRAVDPRLADLGRLLWFDTVTGLNGDNACAGCHSPTAGFGDTQSIAIGIESNGVVGPGRAGPRNMRRAPMVLDTAFFPRLMWNSRFESLSFDPFENDAGFAFPEPEGSTLSYLPHLLEAQAFIPPTERTEVAGFDFQGDNDAIRAEVARRVDAAPEYRRLFGRIFPEVRSGGPVRFGLIARAIAEFEFSLTFADAPVDRYARGELHALTEQQKRGAILFFGRAGCVACHAVSGGSNEMFSDFREHVLAVPQVVPADTNNVFDGPAANEDFGREDATGDPGDRYAFRTPSLRNVAVEASFMHDGAFTTLEAAIRHHLDAAASARGYDPAAQGLDADLTGPIGPVEPMVARLDPLLASPLPLTEAELGDLVAFVGGGLLDRRARPERLRSLVPARLPSGRPPLVFEFPR
jgi:cytochrome c peroxidase